MFTHLFPYGLKCLLTKWHPGHCARRVAVWENTCFSCLEVIPTFLHLYTSSNCISWIVAWFLWALVAVGCSRPSFLQRPLFFPQGNLASCGVSSRSLSPPSPGPLACHLRPSGRRWSALSTLYWHLPGCIGLRARMSAQALPSLVPHACVVRLSDFLSRLTSWFFVIVGLCSPRPCWFVHCRLSV